MTIIKVMRCIKDPFRIIYAPQVKSHLHAIDRKYYSQIRQTICQQLQHQPLEETRNRKPLKQPAVLEADWELRFGPDNRFRVFYTVDESTRQVSILAIGVKQGAILHIGGEENAL